MAAIAALAPTLGDAAVVPFLAVAGLAFFGIRDGEWFETLALPGDREEERLYGFVAFSVAAAGLALFASLSRAPLPHEAFAAAALAVGGGRLGREVVSRSTTDEFPLVAGYVGVGALAALAGQVAVRLQTELLGADGGFSVGGPIPVLNADLAEAASSLAAALPDLVFLASVAALTAALVRSLVFARDAHITVILVAFAVWGFLALDPAVTVPLVAFGLGVTAALGYVSFALGTASVPGMLTGVLSALLAVVLGGIGWFLTLMAFYAVGALASKYRFDEKADRGVAQENEGARGTGNVLANSAVALVALLGYAATARVAVPPAPFAFAGATATAMADTLSSEIGGLFDGPRLVTTLQRVEPGTDGAGTWQGEIAGLAGALLVGGIAAIGMPVGDPVVGGGIVVLAGFAGMTVDSVLGAAVEGDRVGNQAVNFLATLSGATVAVAFGVAPL